MSPSLTSFGQLFQIEISCFYFSYRAKEWLVICERPDLMRRVDIGDITINNYYVCETHFPNQILDYATRKILIKTAKPLTVAELKAMPAKSRRKGEAASKIRRHSEEYDVHIEDGFDEDDYDLEESNGEDGFSAFTNIDDLKSDFFCSCFNWNASWIFFY